MKLLIKTCCVISSVIGLILIIIYIIIPFVFRYSPSFQREMILANDVTVTPKEKLSHPHQIGLKGTKNFYFTTMDNVTLGVWHVLPNNLLKNYEDDFENYELLLGHGESIVIYMHGNADNRANFYRGQLYSVLQNINCHVIALDYRSYADSSDITPNELGLVMDVVHLYKWVYNRANKSSIFGYGHSLGTAIGAHAFALLEKDNLISGGLILDAPFSKLSEAIEEFPLAKLYNFLPWFGYFFVYPIAENGFVFNTEENLKYTKMPILILHAHDDIIVPYKLGKKLFDHLSKYRVNSTTELISYDSKLKYSHFFIYKDKDLGNKIKKFMDKSIKNNP
ncbi:lysophosphatidylserine lipase ABHD12-like isoform X2 [Daktulosphaira vitifoliae]|uniref:lysophosphatidylserine lipase ABHD12-like isoform X2 n=1 Tax=Daktulosphaira vitifoliae TaxID=58002 RepID=UPI0021A9FF11|nr:lysophosphatidylserine lipase ABHD12-like isoform X2 [Daktulosphaira vitifoliae]